MLTPHLPKALEPLAEATLSLGLGRLLMLVEPPDPEPLNPWTPGAASSRPKLKIRAMGKPGFFPFPGACLKPKLPEPSLNLAAKLPKFRPKALPKFKNSFKVAKIGSQSVAQIQSKNC